MKKIKLLFLIGISLLFLQSCVTDLVDETELVGNWEGIELLKDTIPSNRPPSDVKFEFRADSTYTYRLSNEFKEEGTWYTLQDKLYTTPDGGKKFSVILEPIGSDTMVFHQNRGGKPEHWKLMRK